MAIPDIRGDYGATDHCDLARPDLAGDRAARAPAVHREHGTFCGVLELSGACRRWKRPGRVGLLLHLATTVASCSSRRILFRCASCGRIGTFDVAVSGCGRNLLYRAAPALRAKGFGAGSDEERTRCR